MSSPVAIRLPFWLAERFEPATWVARSRAAADPTAFRCFGLARHEWAFARELLRRRRNLWVFRCHQKRACGDFALVDMSAPRPELRTAWVVELKSRGRPARPGLQLRNVDAVRRELSKIGVADTAHPLRLDERTARLRWGIPRR